MNGAIIFGINGQDGYYLSRQLKMADIEITGVSRSSGDWLRGDVSDREFVTSLIRNLKPAYIFHLAAHSKTLHELLFEHQATIVNGSLNILDAVYHYSPETRVFITGSGLQFKNTGSPIHESAAFEARDAYSLARIQSVYAARYYREKGVKTFIGYLFHHDSPFRNEAHLSRRIAEAALAAAAGREYPLSIGDISVEKEYGFAGDIANGIFHLVQQDSFSEACIGTGKAYRVEHWLEICFGAVGKRWQDHVSLHSGYTPAFRKMVSDPSLLLSTGWKPELDIRELAELMLKPAPQS